MSLAPKSVFISGCSRGLGLEFVKQFLSLPNPPKHIFATCRNLEKAQVFKKLLIHILIFVRLDGDVLRG